MADSLDITIFSLVRQDTLIRPIELCLGNEENFISKRHTFLLLAMPD